MVELGSNNGDTLFDFIQRCPDFKQAYCFEPDNVCIKILGKKCLKYNDRIKIIPKIAWNKSGKIGFASGGGDGTSKVILQGNVAQIETVLVDDEIKESITYMKMDIEGSEMMALQGARNQI